jgi:hypothetical protein
MARGSTRWVWPAVGAAAVAAIGVVVWVLVSNGGDGGEPNDSAPLPATVGLSEGVRFELLTGRCGYEVVVTAETTVEPRNGQFCLVRIDVRNKGDVPRSFDPSCQYLIDTSGGRHGQREDVLPLDADSADFFAGELPPQTPADDIGLYYDVPKETDAAAVELHTACDSPGARLEVVE